MSRFNLLSEEFLSSSDDDDDDDSPSSDCEGGEEASSFADLVHPPSSSSNDAQANGNLVKSHSLSSLTLKLHSLIEDKRSKESMVMQNDCETNSVVSSSATSDTGFGEFDHKAIEVAASTAGELTVGDVLYLSRSFARRAHSLSVQSSRSSNSETLNSQTNTTVEIASQPEKRERHQPPFPTGKLAEINNIDCHEAMVLRKLSSSSLLSLLPAEEDGSVIEDLPELSMDANIFDTGIQDFALVDECSKDTLLHVRLAKDGKDDEAPSGPAVREANPLQGSFRSRRRSLSGNLLLHCRLPGSADWRLVNGPNSSNHSINNNEKNRMDTSGKDCEEDFSDYVDSVFNVPDCSPFDSRNVRRVDGIALLEHSVAVRRIGKRSEDDLAVSPSSSRHHYPHHHPPPPVLSRTRSKSNPIILSSGEITFVESRSERQNRYDSYGLEQPDVISGPRVRVLSSEDCFSEEDLFEYLSDREEPNHSMDVLQIIEKERRSSFAETEDTIDTDGFFGDFDED